MGQNELSGMEPGEERRETSAAAEERHRKAFVEPAVSFPIDVLEATTFFQLTDSGTTT